MDMGSFCENSKYFRDMVIQSFLNYPVGRILLIFINFFSGIWDTFRNIKRIWDTRDPPSRAPGIALKTFIYLVKFLEMKDHLSRNIRFPTMWYVLPAKAQINLRIRAV